MASEELDSQLPYIQIHRSVGAKAAHLAALASAPYHLVRGVLECFWESLADRRVLQKALASDGCIVLTRAEIMNRLCRLISPSCTPDDIEMVGFIEAFPARVGSYRVRGMSRYLQAEATRASKKGKLPQGLTPVLPLPDPGVSESDPGATPVPPGSDPPEERGERKEERGKTEDKKQKRREERSKPKQVSLPEMPPKPETERKSTPASEVWAYFVERRNERLEDLGLDPSKHELRPNWGHIAAQVEHWHTHVAEDVEVAKGTTRLMITQFLEDPYWASATDNRSGAPEPYPWGALASEKVWRPLLAKVNAIADAYQPGVQ